MSDNTIYSDVLPLAKFTELDILFSLYVSILHMFGHPQVTSLVESIHNKTVCDKTFTSCLQAVDFRLFVCLLYAWDS